MTDIHQTEARIGDTMTATYTVLGMRFAMEWTVVGYERPRNLTVRMEGGFKGTFGLSLEPEGDSTRVDWRIEYEMMGGILGTILDALFAKRMNERNSERSLENLKRVFEAG